MDFRIKEYAAIVKEWQSAVENLNKIREKLTNYNCEILSELEETWSPNGEDIMALATIMEYMRNTKFTRDDSNTRLADITRWNLEGMNRVLKVCEKKVKENLRKELNIKIEEDE